MALITIPSPSGSGGGSVTLPQSLGVTDTPTFKSMNTSTTLSVGTSMNVGTSLTVGILSGMIYANAGTLAAATIGDGQILVGKSGQTAPVSLYLTGTGISISQTATELRLSLPQDISFDATPSFNGINLGSGLLELEGNLSVQGTVQCLGLQSGAGTALVLGQNAQVLTLTSSIEHKENIVSASSIVNPKRLLGLVSKYYNYKAHKEVKAFGYIAEELHNQIPELVIYKDGKPNSIQYLNFVPLIIDLLKEHDSKIESLSRPVVVLNNTEHCETVVKKKSFLSRLFT